MNKSIFPRAAKRRHAIKKKAPATRREVEEEIAWLQRKVEERVEDAKRQFAERFAAWMADPESPERLAFSRLAKLPMVGGLAEGTPFEWSLQDLLRQGVHRKFVTRARSRPTEKLSLSHLKQRDRDNLHTALLDIKLALAGWRIEAIESLRAFQCVNRVVSVVWERAIDEMLDALEANELSERETINVAPDRGGGEGERSRIAIRNATAGWFAEAVHDHVGELGEPHTSDVTLLANGMFRDEPSDPLWTVEDIETERLAYVRRDEETSLRHNVLKPEACSRNQC